MLRAIVSSETMDTQSTDLCSEVRSYVEKALKMIDSIVRLRDLGDIITKILSIMSIPRICNECDELYEIYQRLIPINSSIQIALSSSRDLENLLKKLLEICK